MINKEDMRLSKFLSLVLRHKPEKANITLDKNGYVSVDKLILEMNKMGMKVTKDDISRIVEQDDKKRYSYDEFDVEDRIRANQGHSIDVDLELRPVAPPLEIYHGTATRFLDGIREFGLQKRNRNYVHMSPDIETAKKVGVRYGDLAILKIDVYNMIKDGYKFYCSENGVYLTDHVPLKYITLL